MSAHPRTAASALAALLLLLAGCGSADRAGGKEAAPTQAPAPDPVLSEPIRLDDGITVLTDDGYEWALAVNRTQGNVAALDAQGRTLWTLDAEIDIEHTQAVRALSFGELVILDTGTGAVIAYEWKDGTTAWSFTPTTAEIGCADNLGFTLSSTASGSRLSSDDVLLFASIAGESADDISPGSCQGEDTAMPLVFGIDPKTGKQAWPALRAGADARAVQGVGAQVSPDGRYAYLAWKETGGEYVTRLDTASGRSASIDLTGISQAGEFAVYPQTSPEALTYATWSADDDVEGLTSGPARVGMFHVAADLPETAAGDIDADDALDAEAAGIDFTDDAEQRCAAPARYTPAGAPVCLQTRVFASQVAVVGSPVDGTAWEVEVAEEAASAGLLDPLFPIPAHPVDGPEAPVAILPGTGEHGVRAVDARTGEGLWESGERLGPYDDYTGRWGWGGNGYLPAVDLVPVLLNQHVSFLHTADGTATGEPVEVADYAEASASDRFFAVAHEEGTTLWAVTGGPQPSAEPTQQG